MSKIGWEKMQEEVSLPNTRTVKLRAAKNLSPDRDGIFDTILRLVRFGLGGRAGDGRQYVSWIHEVDFIRSVYWLLEHRKIIGAVNLAVPYPLPYSEFMQTIREAWGTRIGQPVTKWMLEIGAFLLRK